VPLIRALFLMIALVSPALAETLSSDGAALATRANDAAKELRIYLADVAKAGGRPDFLTSAGFNAWMRSSALRCATKVAPRSSNGWLPAM